MQEKLAVALEQLKSAKVQMTHRTLRRQVSLFEFEESQEIEFNGHRSIGSYEDHLHTFFLPCKKMVDQMMNDSKEYPQTLIKEFDLASYEIKEFRRRYFPRKHTHLMFQRVEFQKTKYLDVSDDEALKKNSGLLNRPR